jgi:ketosteroid isomerase-like protein
MATHAAARAWVEAWSRGWRTHDSGLIARRYATDCAFHSQPFREVTHGREAAAAYVRGVFAEEAAARFGFGEPIVSADGRAAVEYRAVITAHDGSQATLAGTTILRFDREGLVTDHRDYWALVDGDHGLELTQEDAP